MSVFYVNGRKWSVIFVDPWDPILCDRTKTMTVATTDPVTSCVYLSRELKGEFLRHVLKHELGHAFMISYGMLNQLHSMTIPKYWIDIEEWICNLLADNATNLTSIADDLMEGWYI